jgi:serine/threonine protein kinase
LSKHNRIKIEEFPILRANPLTDTDDRLGQMADSESGSGGPPPPDFSAFSHLAGYIVDLKDFRKLEVIGHGTFGTVWKGESLVTGWTVAVKELFIDRVLAPRDIELYRGEVEILVRSKAPFLLEFIGFTVAPPYAIVTLFVPNGTLWDAIHGSSVALDAAQRACIAVAIAHGMMCLHRLNAIHLGLTSRNILLDDRYLPKIADMGLVRFMSDCGFNRSPVRDAAWMAPELLSGSPYEASVDVYSYGVILYEMLTGEIPFREFDRTGIRRVVCEDAQRPLLSDPDSEIASLIQSCWGQSLHDRLTFEAIYELFASGSGQWTGANLEAVSAMISEIRRIDFNEEMIENSMIENFVWEWNEMCEMQNAKLQPSRRHELLTKYAREGNIHSLNNLLRAYPHEPDVNTASAGELPLIHAAIQAGQLIVIEYLANLECVDMNVRDQEGNTPLIAAVRVGQERIVGFLAQCRNVNVNLQNKFGMTALHVVALLDASWHEPMLAMLALAGKDLKVDLEDWEGKKPFAAQPEVIAQLLETIETVVPTKHGCTSTRPRTNVVQAVIADTIIAFLTRIKK